MEQAIPARQNVERVHNEIGAEKGSRLEFALRVAARLVDAIADSSARTSFWSVAKWNQ